MATDSQGETIVWSNAGKRPSLFIFFHLSVVIPALTSPFIPYAKLVLLTWVAVDQLLQRYDLSLRAAIMRVRLWVRGGNRRSISRRHYQKLKKGTC